MATVDLGKISFVNKGTYDASTTYEERDVVQFTDSGELSSYVYVNATPASGQTPSTGGTVNSSHWNKFAGGVSLSLGNNKLVSTDGSGNLQGTSIGSVGQVIKVTGTNTLGFGQGGLVLGMKHQRSTGNVTVTRTGSGHTYNDICSGNLTYTPQSTSSKILLILSAGVNNISSNSGTGYGLAMSVAQSGGYNMSNNRQSPYGFYPLNSLGTGYGQSICEQFVFSNTSANQITVTGEGYAYSEGNSCSAQYTQACIVLMEYTES